jgi:hypothetical protein
MIVNPIRPCNLYFTRNCVGFVTKLTRNRDFTWLSLHDLLLRIRGAVVWCQLGFFERSPEFVRVGTTSHLVADHGGDVEVILNDSGIGEDRDVSIFDSVGMRSGFERRSKDRTYTMDLGGWLINKCRQAIDDAVTINYIEHPQRVPNPCRHLERSESIVLRTQRNC